MVESWYRTIHALVKEATAPCLLVCLFVVVTPLHEDAGFTPYT